MSRSTIKDPAKSKSSETFFKVLRFIGRYRFLLILSIILAAVSVILQLYVPILFGNAIDQVIAQHQVNFEMMWYYQPYYRRYRYSIRWYAAWIYPAFFRNRNDHRNTDLHVLQKLLDYIDGHCPDPRKLFGGQIYFFPYLPDVPEAKRCQRTSDCSHRRDDWKPEGCSGFWI